MTCRSHILHAFAVAAMLAGAAFAQEEGERKVSAAERLRSLPKLATACDGLVWWRAFLRLSNVGESGLTCWERQLHGRRHNRAH